MMNEDFVYNPSSLLNLLLDPLEGLRNAAS